MKTSFFSAKFLVVLTIVFAFALVDSAVAVVDLEAQSIEYVNEPADGISHQGEPIGLHWHVFNHGHETSDDYTIEFYVGGYSVGSLSHRGVRPQATSFGWETFSLPSDIPYGNHTLRMEMFCPNDSTPDNNEVSGVEITIAEKGPPDLWFSYFYVPGNLFYGTDSVPLSCTVKNIGHSDSDSYTIDFYIDDDYLGSENRNGIAGHGSDLYFQPRITLPYDCPEGTHLITAELTCSGDSDPGNNSAQGSIRVGKSVPTSVSIESVDAAGDVFLPDEPIVVRIVIDGVGGHLDTSFDVDVYASADLDITTSDYKIHRYDSETISPGESLFLSEACQLPSDIPVGYYHMGIILTYSTEDGTESEQAFDNSIVYIGGYSDVVVQSVGITPGGYMPGEEFVVYSLIKNGGEWSTGGYTVAYYASTDAVITADDHHIGYVDRDGLAPGEQHSYETTFHVPFNLAAGNYYIGAIITCPRESDLANNAGCSEATIELAHPAGYVCGQMQYQPRDRSIGLPIRYALVEVYDADDNEDPLDDRVIGNTHTDQNGNYGIIVLNDQMSSQNIYVKVFTESPIGAYPETTNKAGLVKDYVFDETYYMKSDLYPHPRDLSVVVNMTADRKGGEFMVYDSMIEGFHKAKTFFDVNIPEIVTFWPCMYEASFFNPSDQSMYIAQGDRGDRDVIMHEYGHFIADVFTFAQGDVGENSTHYWIGDLRNYPIQRTDEEARNLTFREAWATLFSIATQYGEKWHPYSGDAIYQDFEEESESTLIIDLEKDTDKKRDPGEFYDHMTCCALWDIFDDSDDKVDDHDSLSDPNLSKIWTVLLASEPNDIIDFWNGWFASYDDYTSEITRIFQDHKMSFVKPNIPVFPSGQNNPPIADAGRDRIYLQTCAEGAYVCLNGRESWDPDEDEMTYEWRLNDNIIATRVYAWLYMLPGTVTITLTVTDGQEYDNDSMKITVIPTDPRTWD
jgi:hypothetical protein